MDRLDLGDLSLRVDEVTPGVLKVRWEGASNSKDPGTGLRPFLALLVSRAREANAVLEHRFEDLRFLNSSTIAALMQFMRDAHARGVRQRYVYDAALRWQATSFEALEMTSRGNDDIEFVALRSGDGPRGA